MDGNSLINDDIPSYLLKMCSEQLGIQSIEPNDDFFEIGGRSIDMFMIFARLEADLGTAIDFEPFFELPTLQSLIAIVEQEATQ